MLPLKLKDMNDETKKIIEEKDALIKTLKERINQLQNLLSLYQQSASRQYSHNQDYHPYGDDEYDR